MIRFKSENRQASRRIWLLLLLPVLWGNTIANETAPASDTTYRGSSNVASSGTFSVISYNVAGLPQFISSAVTERASSTREIGGRLNRYDIVHVQEDFNYNKMLYSQNEHPFRSVNKGKVPFGDGLNTLSKFPFRELRRIKWDHCTGADCLTPKGFTYSRIEIAKSVFVDFYNVHANAYNEPEAAEARRQNVIQLSDYIKQHSAGNAVVVMGDLNGHYAFELDNISLLLDLHQMKDVWIAHQSGGLAPRASAVIPAKDILSISDSMETIDKILYRGSAAVQLESVGYELEKEQFTNAAGLPLSDHHPISAQFVWKLKAQQDSRLAKNSTLGKREVQR